MATSKLRWGNYAELRPEQLATIRKQTPVLYLPCGSIAWHGAHLPLGTDTLTVEAIGEQVVRRTGGRNLAHLLAGNEPNPAQRSALSATGNRHAHVERPL